MVRLAVLAILVGLLLYPGPALAASWLMQGHDVHGTNFNSSEYGIGRHNVSRLRPVWSFPGAIQIVATDKRVFASLTGHGGVAVIDAGDGTRLRLFTDRYLGVAGLDSVTALAYGHGLLVVASYLGIRALDPYSGRVAWHVQSGATSLTTDGRTLYTAEGCQDGCRKPASEAIDLATGRILWQHPGNFGGPPVLIAGNLYQPWGEVPRLTRVYDASSGAVIGSLQLNAGSWIGDGTRSYAVGSASGGKPAWIARIAGNGTRLWTMPLGHPIESGVAPAFAYQRLYAASNRYHPGLIAVNANSGRMAWAADIGPVSSIVVANHLVFAANAVAPTVDVLDAGTGRILRLISLTRRIGAAGKLLVAGGRLYGVSATGTVALAP